VGYQIRLEAKRSDATRLLFCTTGVLLRRLQASMLREA
jgi:HrpA-like RNA helicase